MWKTFTNYCWQDFAVCPGWWSADTHYPVIVQVQLILWLMGFEQVINWSTRLTSICSRSTKVEGNLTENNNNSGVHLQCPTKNILIREMITTSGDFLTITNFYLKNKSSSNVLFWPLLRLFWISGDVSSGCQRQSGFCLICIVEANVKYIPWDPPLVLHIAKLLMDSIVGRWSGSYLAQEYYWHRWGLNLCS